MKEIPQYQIDNILMGGNITAAAEKLAEAAIRDLYLDILEGIKDRATGFEIWPNCRGFKVSLERCQHPQFSINIFHSWERFIEAAKDSLEEKELQRLVKSLRRVADTLENIQ